jgi:peptide/nickel transport system permease protein
VVVTLWIATAVAGPALIQTSPRTINLQEALRRPDASHIMGTDDLGRDVFTRLVHGSRVALMAGVVAVGIAVVIGLALGMITGYSGGSVDNIVMRVLDAVWAFPTLVLALGIATILGPGLINALCAIGIVYTPLYARLVRGQVLSVRQQEYVTAARALGASDAAIMSRHIWPNITSPVIVQASLGAGQAIIALASLSFLGLGVVPPQPDWGSMLRDGYGYLGRAPWMSLFPGGAIFVSVLALNFLGDGLRGALDVTL